MASSLVVMSEAGRTAGLVSTSSGRCSPGSARPIVNHRSRAQPAVDVDFSAYLLSASPPGFELSPGVFGCGLPPSQRFSSSNSNNTFQKWNWSPTSPTVEWSTCGLESIRVGVTDSSDSDSEPSQLPSSTRSSLSGSRANSTGSSSLTKKVSFADDLGKMLAQIRIFNESSDTPPTISPKVLRRHASADSLLATSTPLKRSFRAEVLHRSASSPVFGQEVAVPRLTPNFPMPAADRSSYLERIDRACVSLESLHVLPVESRPATTGNGMVGGYGAPPVVDRLVGSVGVRNVAFEKAVTVRCTFDGWASYLDVKAVYSRSERAQRMSSASGKPLGELCFDVFDFSVNLPVRWRATGGRRVELALRYDVGGRAFWDNNDGRNYELVGTSPDDQACPRAHTTDDFEEDPDSRCWTEFSGWRDVDSSCPYW